jgi:hypothetical protein
MEGEPRRPQGGEAEDEPGPRSSRAVGGSKVEGPDDDESGSPEDIYDAGVANGETQKPEEGKGDDCCDEASGKRADVREQDGRRCDRCDNEDDSVAVDDGLPERISVVLGRLYMVKASDGSFISVRNVGWWSDRGCRNISWPSTGLPSVVGFQ